MYYGAINLSQLVGPLPPPSEVDDDIIDALLKFLKASQTKDRTTKSVVFSQWNSFLDVVEKAML
ncbi:hypothetical protein BC938DRAFT_482448, partial [Jimgerdemannia flammicorona]